MNPDDMFRLQESKSVHEWPTSGQVDLRKHPVAGAKVFINSESRKMLVFGMVSTAS
jgi:hypothetical protein